MDHESMLTMSIAEKIAPYRYPRSIGGEARW